MKGLILKGTNNSFTVECDDGVVRTCKIKGKVLKKCDDFYNPIATGDFVNIELDVHSTDEGSILNLIERKNCFLRKNPKTNSPQLLAANIDKLLCVTSAENPPFRPRFIDRLLVQAGVQNIDPIIVINKCDLNILPEVSERIDVWKQLGYEVLLISAKTKEGLDELIKKIAGITVAVVGQSGVGKSSLLNAICPDLKLRTSEISDKHDRGTHTTTQGVFLNFELKDKNVNTQAIKIIDTPGVRNFSIFGIEKNEIAIYFPEFEPLLGKCKFGLSCTHTHETGCVILDELKKKNIYHDRYVSWQLMVGEL